MVGLKKPVTYAKISPLIVNPTDIAGNTEEEEEEETNRNIKHKLLNADVVEIVTCKLL